MMTENYAIYPFIRALLFVKRREEKEGEFREVVGVVVYCRIGIKGVLVL